MEVKLEGQKALEWIIPWKFTYGSDGDEISTEGIGICWLWWTFYFKKKRVYK